MRVLNTSQMREADRRTIEGIGIPSVVLMENAGREVVAAIEARYADLEDRQVAVLCGRGNNGGDGFVVARRLRQRHVAVSVFVVGRVSDLRGDARLNLDILGRLGLRVEEVDGPEAWEQRAAEIARADLIVDALVGTGLTSGLSGLLETVVTDLNAMEAPIVSIDMPSGLSADSPDLIGPSIAAALTVTLAAPKLPLVVPPASFRAGELVVADIGIPLAVIDEIDGPRIELMTRSEVRELVQPRRPDAHKGSFGHVLVVAGGRGKTGAARLAAVGALRSGAGLVTVATPRSCQPIVAALGSEYMTDMVAEGPDGAIAAEAADRILAFPCDVVAAGPGLGSGDGTRSVVRGLLERSRVPIVLDADALNAFADDAGGLAGRDGLDVIVTPHPGEMARLLGIRTEQVQSNRLETARRLAIGQRLYVVLKGHRTIIATPDGKTFVNPTGNPGMATGGTGDVLTGMIAAWLAQLLDPEAACRVAVYLHGAAGDLATADEGEIAMTAGDLADRIGDAILELSARRTLER